VIAAALAACGDNGNKTVDAKPDVAVDAGQSPVDRGRYLMNDVAACGFCHTPLNPDGSRDLTRLFAGVDCLIDADGMPNNGFGCISSRNLTNDPTGLMNATDDQIKDAFRNGMRTDGKYIVPLMPYYVFHNMTDDDASAIVAYLRTVPGISHTVQANEEPWLDYNDNGPAATPISVDAIPLPSPSFGDQASAMRGRYLTSQVGLCIDCHTPRRCALGDTDPSCTLNDEIRLEEDKEFWGGFSFTADQLGLQSPPYPMIINSRNLTPDATGLMGETAAQIKASIQQGKDPDGNAVCAATHGSMISPYAGMTDDDMNDVVNFIMSLAPVSNDTGSNCAGPAVP
jgi:hypothetical protein